MSDITSLNQERIHETLKGADFADWAGGTGLPVAPDNAAPEMIWMDMETTGLAALQDVPLESGIILTDRWGNLIRDSAARWLIFDYTNFHWANRLTKMEDVVREMHEKSGLLADLAEVAKMPIAACPPSSVENSMLHWLVGKFGQFDAKDKMPPCGSSIGFDRKFMELWMPTLYEWFHYRNGDVSSWRYFVNLHRPEVTASEPEKKKYHRVIPDIVDSIHLYRHLVHATLIKEA